MNTLSPVVVANNMVQNLFGKTERITYHFITRLCRIVEFSDIFISELVRWVLAIIYVQ